jgi:S1-C subfamily serine protease
MRNGFLIWCFLQIAIASTGNAAGPYGTIHIAGWSGGAYTDDNGTFSHCAAGANYASGVSLVVSQTATNSWLLGFGSSAFHFTKGDTLPIDVTFDGQSQARLFATANSPILISAILPPNITHAFQKSSLMVAVAGGTALQFNLTSTGPLLAALANCVAKVKAEGVNSAGDFAAPKVVPAKADVPNAAPGTPKAASKSGTKSGTGFVISASGHIVSNYHVIAGCAGDIHGNLAGEPATTLRLVAGDERNDLALLQGPASTFREFARIRDRTIRSGDSVVAIGYPFHGLLTSDFTVTTGIVSSLSGLRNDTRFLQISAAVQPGNSGGPLLDSGGQIVGMVAGKLDALSMARATGDIPENVNFAIKTGAIRDFLDNSVVPYETSEPRDELKTSELKTTEIAGKARAYTLLISCTATEPVESARR